MKKPILRWDAPPTPTVANQALNPGLGTGRLNGWNSNNGAIYPVTLDSTAPISGNCSALTTRLASTPNTVAASLYLGGLDGLQFSVTAGVPITGAVDVKAELGARKIIGRFLWYNAASTNISNSTTTTINNTLANTVYRVLVTATPPATAVKAYFIPEVQTMSGNATAGERCWFDNLYIGSNPAGTYVDGDSPEHYWEGGRCLSRSMRYAQVVPAATNKINNAFPTEIVGADTIHFTPQADYAGTATAKVAPTMVNDRPAVRCQAVGTTWPAQPNLVTAGSNGAFVSDITGWTGTLASVAFEPSIARAVPNGSLKVTCTAVSANAGALATVTGLTVGQTYTAECWIYLPAASAGCLPSMRGSGIPGITSYNKTVSATDVWTYSSKTFTASAISHQIFVGTNWTTTAGMVFYVDDVKVYAVQNMMVAGDNGTFEGNASFWSALGTQPNIQRDTSRAHSGTGSLKVTWPTAGSNNSLAASDNTDSPTVVGQQYTAEAWIYVPAGGADVALRQSMSSTTSTPVTARDQWVFVSLTWVAQYTTVGVQIINAQATTSGQLCYVDDVRLYKSNNTITLGSRTAWPDSNFPVLATGTTFVFSAWVYLSATVSATSITCVFRDEAGNDSAAATFDALTPASQTVPPRSGWYRLSWKATVKGGGRVVTGIILAATGGSAQPVGAYLDTTCWMAQVDGQVGTEPYFDDLTYPDRIRFLTAPYSLWDGTQCQPLTVAGRWNGTVIQPTTFASVEVDEPQVISVDPAVFNTNDGEETSVTITGWGFATLDIYGIWVGDARIYDEVITSTTITGTVYPANMSPGIGDVRVYYYTDPAQTENASLILTGAVTVTAPPPVAVTSVSPTQVIQGTPTPFNIYGENLDGVSAVEFSGYDPGSGNFQTPLRSLEHLSDTHLRGNFFYGEAQGHEPQLTGPVSMGISLFTNAGYGTNVPNAVTLIPHDSGPMTITAITPTAGKGVVHVTITGTAFIAKSANGADIGYAAYVYPAVISQTTVTGPVDVSVDVSGLTPGVYDVHVSNNGGEATLPRAFTVTP